VIMRDRRSTGFDDSSMRRWPLLFAAAAVPPLLLLVSMPVLLNRDLRRSVPVLISYRSLSATGMGGP
jgi:hypothetical protein